ncbi:MAG: hypothetical protein IE926_16905 [Micrococcales bacterium]|nr:hypothetical protein [Micrococcales bacterium]
MATERLRLTGGALDGLTIDGLPGELQACSVVYVDEAGHTRVNVSSVDSDADSIEAIALILSAARQALVAQGVDPEAALADVADRTHVTAVVVGRNDFGGGRS